MPYSDSTKRAEYGRQYRADNVERLRVRKREWWRSRRADADYRRMALYNKAKYRAKQRGIPFTIEFGAIVWPDRCPVLGVPLDYGMKGCRGSKPNSPSLDRIDPAKGYTPGNVQVVSMRANSVKQDATADEIAAVAEYCRIFS